MSDRERLRLSVRGAVQGVGFRPFVFRLARELALDGWVANSPHDVSIEVEGPSTRLEQFLVRVSLDAPARAIIHGIEPTWLDPVPFSGFEIRPSEEAGRAGIVVLPDIAMCADCRREILDPADRRYRYAFTNCTNCGPRFSIIEAMPYDRRFTSMRRFEMCEACRYEYESPLDRRFHAQPIACPACGPQLAFWDGRGRPIAERNAALEAAIAEVRAGRIVAVKGLGGFHLVVDATREDAVARLRLRKHREEKPLAVMCPDLEEAVRACDISTAEVRLLHSPESPIVLLRRRSSPAQTGQPHAIASNVAPGNPYLGVMLPYTPLHHLLLEGVGRPVVATSANLSDEPICIDEDEARRRLEGIADCFLVHDRPIVRHVDDSIVRLMGGREMVVRRARGYAPLPIRLDAPGPPVAAVGAHQKNAIALAADEHVFVSQHIGDLETVPAAATFEHVLADLQALFRTSPVAIAADRHPDYASTRHAHRLGLPVIEIQHHVAHVASCRADNGLGEAPVLGVAWDGTGYGDDGTVWGGEFLRLWNQGYERVASLRPFRVPGGARGVRDPRRSAMGVLWEMFGTAAGVTAAMPPMCAALPESERRVVVRALERGVNAPLTTSAGRLFDAVASLIGLSGRSSFEGQAAMALEFAASTTDVEAYPFTVAEGGTASAHASWAAPHHVLDWASTIEAILHDVRSGIAASIVASRFHVTLVDMIVAIARRIGESKVVLSGGCFQNRLLTEICIGRLRAAGFTPYWHQRVPPNDGGIALGQAIMCRQRMSVLSRPVVSSLTLTPGGTDGSHQGGIDWIAAERSSHSPPPGRQD